VGTFGGSEDHTAILTAQPGHIRQYAYCPVRFQKTIPLPAACTFAVASSGVQAEKTGAALDKYNRASRLAAATVALWRRETGRSDSHLAAALHSGAGAAERWKEILSNAMFDEFGGDELVARLEHFVVENEVVIPAAGDALERGDLSEFGRWVDRSQEAAEQLLGNQIAETRFLAATARELGAAAASAFGAGFGGSVWAMIDRREADRFLAAWRGAYRARFPQPSGLARFFATAAGPAMFRLA
jgi:galactokinase